jgi:hypothetical protein
VKLAPGVRIRWRDVVTAGKVRYRAGEGPVVAVLIDAVQVRWPHGAGGVVALPHDAVIAVLNE